MVLGFVVCVTQPRSLAMTDHPVRCLLPTAPWPTLPAHTPDQGADSSHIITLPAVCVGQATVPSTLLPLRLRPSLGTSLPSLLSVCPRFSCRLVSTPGIFGLPAGLLPGSTELAMAARLLTRPLIRAPALTISSSRGYSSENEGSWFRSLFVHKVDPRKDAHSTLLAKRETRGLYKIQFHNVKPEYLDAYNSLAEEVLPKLHKATDYPCELVGNWNTWYGDQDQAVHLWRFSGGYPALTECMNKLITNKEYSEFRKERSKMLLSRRNQLLLEFSFWNEPLPRPGPNIYELRTYRLKPGTMIEWGNNWARAIHHRQENDEAVGGFFSQIGELYVVHHLWAYKDLQSREETRKTAWTKRGWDENVYYTVPLVRNMESRIMIPLKISPLQ